MRSTRQWHEGAERLSTARWSSGLPSRERDARKLNDVMKGGGYKDDELGRKDKFDRAFTEADAWYVGKPYKHRATEVLSMGMQKMYNDPVEFAKLDPEYCKWVLGILDGSLR